MENCGTAVQVPQNPSRSSRSGGSNDEGQDTEYTAIEHVQTLSPLPPVVLILVGLIGSGKSSFAGALQQYYPDFLRCNQDELGNRRRVEVVARHHLSAGGSVCIDRTNIDASQRDTWIRLARDFPGTLVWVLVFDTPATISEERLRNRVGHPTITSVEQGLAVLQRFLSQYEPPHPGEGYDQSLRLSLSDQPSGPVYSKTDVENIIHRLQTLPRVSPVNWSSWGFTRGGHSSGSSRDTHFHPTSVRGGQNGYNTYRGNSSSYRGGYGPYRGGRARGYGLPSRPFGVEPPRTGYSFGSRTEAAWRHNPSNRGGAA